MSNSHAYLRESAMLDWKARMATLNEEAIKILNDYQNKVRNAIDKFFNIVIREMKKQLIVLQEGNKDCAAACLLSIIRYYGGDISLDRLIISYRITDASGNILLDKKSTLSKVDVSPETYNYTITEFNTTQNFEVQINDNSIKIICFIRQPECIVPPPTINNIRVFVLLILLKNKRTVKG